MNKSYNISFTFLFLSILIFSACSGTMNGNDNNQETASAQDHFSTISVCDLDESMLGDMIHVTGEITFVEAGNPQGKFAQLSEQGCSAGIFAPNLVIKTWDADKADLMSMGNQVVGWGELVSVDGELIVDLQDIDQGSVKKDGSNTQDDTNLSDVLDLPAPAADTMLDVPLLYSGSNDLPGLCYLGAAGMLAKYQQPALDFSDIIALSGMGSSALHLNFSGYPSRLISPYMDQSMVFLAENLEMPFALGTLSGGLPSDTFQPANLPFEKHAEYVMEYADSEEALTTLKQALSAGYPVVVYLNLFYVHEDFAEDSTFWRDVLGKDQASHYMVVKGYDAQYVYFNDPTDPTNAAGALSARWETFMEAWEQTGLIPDAPQLGPFWTFFLTDTGSVPGTEMVISLNLEKAIDAPKELRSFANTPDNDPMTLFLLLELANARKQYSQYLAAHGYADASDVYAQSGTLMEEMAVSRNVKPENINQCADLEAEAIQLLN